jgi:nucleoside-diphosphate-sugar epimerase
LTAIVGSSLRSSGRRSKSLSPAVAGFLGSAIVRKLRERGAGQVLVPRSAEYDLRPADHIAKLFDGALAKRAPENTVVIHAAARVGGIGANLRNRATFFYDNALMGIQLLDATACRRVGKFVSVGSACAYPKSAAAPFCETDLWSGYPEETNAAYRLAKKMLLVQGSGLWTQYGSNSIFLLPTNLYGSGDSFDLEDTRGQPRHSGGDSILFVLRRRMVSALTRSSSGTCCTLIHGGPSSRVRSSAAEPTPSHVGAT